MKPPRLRPVIQTALPLVLAACGATPIPDLGVTQTPPTTPPVTQPDQPDASTTPTPPGPPAQRDAGNPPRVNRPPVCACATSPINARLFETVSLDGSQSSDPDGDPIECTWSVVTRPWGSMQWPTITAPGMADFVVDAPGDYLFRLECRDPSGGECVPCDVGVRAAEGSGLRVMIIWDKNDVDVDLHLRRKTDGARWFGPDDVYFGNRSPRFPSGLACSLVLDDTDGFGPEIAECTVPAQGSVAHTFDIGVHYYSDDTLGATNATVQIYCSGQLVAEKAGGTLQRTNAWWDVGTVQFPGCQVNLTDPPALTTRSPSDGMHP